MKPAIQASVRRESANWFPPGLPAPGRQFRSLQGTFAHLQHSYCLAARHDLRSGPPVKQDDRNAAFCAARLSDLLHRSYPPAAAISGFLAACITTYRHNTPFQALYQHITPRGESQAFFPGFFRFFRRFSLQNRGKCKNRPRLCFRQSFVKQMFAFWKHLCYTIKKSGKIPVRCFV